MCPPGLHVSLGIFFRLFTLLEDDCHQLDVSHSLALQGSTAGSTFNTFIIALQHQSTLRDSMDRVREQIQVLEQLLTLTIVTLPPSAPQFSPLTQQLITEINTKKKRRMRWYRQLISIIIMSSVSHTHCVYGRKLR